LAADQVELHAVLEQPARGAVVSWSGPPQPGVGQAREARRELQAEEIEQREDDVAVAGGVGAVDSDRQLAAVVQDAVQRVCGVTDGGADYAGREVRVLIADPAVVGEPAVAAEVAR
jgi:hypothetical protein